MGLFDNKTPEQKRIEQQQATVRKEISLEQKFGVPFRNRVWFECTIEEMKYSTFSNTNTRNVDHAYVIVEDTYMEIIKESVFLKSNMGHRKVYFQNVASIDYDAKGKLHASNSLIINFKSNEHVQLKHVPEDSVKCVTDVFERYLNRQNNAFANAGVKISPADELMKYAELCEKGFLTKEEFDLKKAELMGSGGNASKSTEGLLKTSVKAPKFCGECGSPLEPDSNFCSNCGARL